MEGLIFGGAYIWRGDLKEGFWRYRFGELIFRGASLYILLFACSLNIAVHLKLLPNQTAEEFIKHLKWFITRKGHPRNIYWYKG